MYICLRLLAEKQVLEACCVAGGVYNSAACLSMLIPYMITLIEPTLRNSK